MADPKAIMDQMSNTTDPAKRKALEEQYRAALKENALSAEGEMYAGKNNDAAMRAGEAAKTQLGRAKRQGAKISGFPSDFPIGFIDELREMMRRQSGDMKLNPDQATLIDFYEKNKANIKLNPSQEKFRGPKPKTIPQAVESL